MTHFNEEAIVKAKQAKSVEDLLTLAKESGVEMTAEQAQEYYTQLNPKSGELADDELDGVVGGLWYKGMIMPTSTNAFAFLTEQGGKVPVDLKKLCPDIPYKIVQGAAEVDAVIRYSLEPLDFIS